MFRGSSYTSNRRAISAIPFPRRARLGDAPQDSEDGLHVAQVIFVRPRGFENCRLVAQLGMGEERAKTFETDVPFADYASGGRGSRPSGTCVSLK